MDALCKRFNNEIKSNEFDILYVDVSYNGFSVHNGINSI